VPPPVPPPGPAPIPVATKLHVTLVYSTGDFAELQATAPVRLSRPIAVALDGQAPLNAAWHSYPSDSAIVTRLNLMGPVTKAGGTPALVVQDATGKVVSAMKCPADPADVLAEVHKLRGF
jgi:hypothetical protein